jgi:hypothetical protein
MLQIGEVPGIVALLAGENKDTMVFKGWYAYRFKHESGRRVGAPANTLKSGRAKYVSPWVAGNLHGFGDEPEDFTEALRWVISETTDTVFYGLYYHQGPGLPPARVVLRDDGEVVPWPKLKSAGKGKESYGN